MGAALNEWDAERARGVDIDKEIWENRGEDVARCASIYGRGACSRRPYAHLFMGARTWREGGREDRRQRVHVGFVSGYWQ